MPSTRSCVAAICLLVIPLACAPFAFAEETAPDRLEDEQIARTLLDAEATGLAIFRHDQAAAMATDAAMRIKAFRQDGKRARLAGWVTEERGGGIVVTFISSDAVPQARYRIQVSGDGNVVGDVEVLSAPVALSAFELAAARARATASSAEFTPCAQTYNSVVLPGAGATDGNWTVYLLPGTTRHGVVPIGGSYRMDVDPTGQHILQQRAYTRSCIALDNPAKAEAMLITHLLDPMPTEVHVFWSLWGRKPLFVGTSAGMWAIEEGKIRLVERRETP